MDAVTPKIKPERSDCSDTDHYYERAKGSSPSGGGRMWWSSGQVKHAKFPPFRERLLVGDSVRGERRKKRFIAEGFRKCGKSAGKIMWRCGLIGS